MVIWNIIALEVPRLRGYPHGPVSYPFMGTPMISPNRICPDHACRHGFLNETRGQYWFGHKLPHQWYTEILGWYRAGASCDVDEGSGSYYVPADPRNRAAVDFMRAG